MRRRLLIVDDEPGMLRAVQRILEATYDVACAGSAEEALARFDAFEPELVILDVRMPGIDGFETMSRLKQRRADVDVILMTGSADESDEKLVRAIRERAFYFIQKPFDRSVLLTLVDRCLEQRRLTDQNRRQLERLENVMAEARSFQNSLLPAPSADMGRVRIRTRYVSCDHLCGDFYDYIACDGAVAFVVADVSGHGASAAMLTGVVKSGFHSCHREGYEPRAVVERIWSGIATFRANRFVTLFAGRVDVEAGRLDYVNAGHCPPLVWNSDSALRALPATGPLVSPVWESPRWEQTQDRFGPGAHLLAYTDGLSEAPGPTEMFEEERIRQGVATRSEGGDVLLDGLLEEVERFMHGRRPVDDLTLMSVAHAR